MTTRTFPWSKKKKEKRRRIKERKKKKKKDEKRKKKKKKKDKKERRKERKEERKEERKKERKTRGHDKNKYSSYSILSILNEPFVVVFVLGGMFLKSFFVPCGKFRSPYPAKAEQPQEQRYPFLSVCAVFSCVQTLV